MRLTITKAHINQRLPHRPAGYWMEMEPAIVERLPDGGFVVETEHPTWKAMRDTYRPLRIEEKKARRRERRNRTRRSFEKAPADSKAIRRRTIVVPGATPPPTPAPEAAEKPEKLSLVNQIALNAVKLLAKPEDTGVGDTVARLIAAGGGETLKSWYEKITGKDCGCADRQAKLNQLFPYER